MAHVRNIQMTSAVTQPSLRKPQLGRGPRQDNRTLAVILQVALAIVVATALYLWIDRALDDALPSAPVTLTIGLALVSLVPRTDGRHP